MAFGTRMSKPMTRKDWAWLLACVVCGLTLVLCIVIPEAIYNNARPYGTRYTFTTSDDGKTTSSQVEQFIVPVYNREVSFRTNDHLQEIINAVEKLNRKDIETHVAYIGPQPLTASDVATSAFEAILLFAMATKLFSIVEKICGRLLGIKSVPQIS